MKSGAVDWLSYLDQALTVLVPAVVSYALAWLKERKLESEVRQAVIAVELESIGSGTTGRNKLLRAVDMVKSKRISSAGASEERIRTLIEGTLPGIRDMIRRAKESDKSILRETDPKLHEIREQIEKAESSRKV